MARALVTGGTGFLGSHLASALEQAGWQVRTLDLYPPGEQSHTSREFVRADVRDAAAVGRAARGCELVVDNAALVPVSRATPEEFRSVNVEGCRVTLAAARAADSYVLHVSSSAIYGVPSRLPVTETTPLAPFEPYGESKAEAEHLVAAERAKGLRVGSLRPRTLLGSGRLGIFDLIFERTRKGLRVPLFGKGDNRVQLCDVEDFCAAALAAVERRADGDYNIGAASFGTVREDIQSLIAHAGTGAKIQPVPVWMIRGVLRPLELVGRSPLTEWHWRSGPASFFFDLEKTRSELGWQPRHSNVDALKRAYDQYVEHPVTRGQSAHSRPLAGRLARFLRG